MKTLTCKMLALTLCAVMLLTSIPTALAAENRASGMTVDEYQAACLDEIYPRYLTFFSENGTYAVLGDSSLFTADNLVSQIYEHEASILFTELGLNLLGEELDRNRWIQELATLIQMQEDGFSTAHEDLARYDTLKTLGDYTLDVAGILSGALLVQNHFDALSTDAMNRIADTLGVTADLADLTLTSLEEYEYVLQVTQSYENHRLFLTAVRDHAMDVELREAADFMLNMVREASTLKLEALGSSGFEVSNVAINDVFGDMFFDAVRASETYKNDESLRALSEWSDTTRKNLLAGLQMGETALELGTFAADMLFGSSDVCNRYAETQAIFWISKALTDAIRPFDTLDPNDLSTVLPEMKQTVPLLQYLTLLRARGEYCMQQLLYADAQLASLMTAFFNDDNDAAMNYYENCSRFLTQTWTELANMFTTDLTFGEVTVVEPLLPETLQQPDMPDGSYDDLLRQLAEEYGVIAAGVEEYPCGEMDIPISEERLTGLLGADIYDYDGDGSEELVTVRIEACTETDQWGNVKDSPVFIEVYDGYNAAPDSACRMVLPYPGLTNALHSSSLQFARGDGDEGVCLYVDYFHSMNSQSFGTLRIAYDGEQLHVTGGVEGSEFYSSAICDTHATDEVLPTMLGRQRALERTGWDEGVYYDFEYADDVDAVLAPYFEELELGLEEIGLKDSDSRSMYDSETQGVQHVYGAACIRPAEHYTMVAGDLTELCGVLSPYAQGGVTLTVYDSTGLQEPCRR